MRKIALLIPLAMLAACGSEEGTPTAPPTPDSTVAGDGVSVDTTDVVVPSDASDDGTPPQQCETDKDCSKAFEDLGACESAACGVDKKCKREPAAKDTTCDDGDPCSPASSCQPDAAGGMVCKAVGGCDDGNPCNGVETCGGSDGCVDGTPLVCADADKCNGEETCDPASGCVPGKALFCAEDGDLCNGGAACDPASGCVQANVPDCDDGLACTKDACDSKAGCVHDLDPKATGCCKSDADCEDGKACTASSCDLATGACKVQNLDGQACSSSDPCTTGGTCAAGECVAQKVESCTVLCTLSGAAGDVIDCPVGLARLAKADPNAVTVGASVGWQGGVATLETLVDSFCIGAACLEGAIPQSSTALQPSGHSVLLTPPAPADWTGTLAVDVANLLDPDKAVSDAWYEADQLKGDASFVSLRFKLTASVGGTPVVLHTLSATQSGGAPLAAKLVGNVIVTSSSPCGKDICFDGHVCTKDACTAGSCTYAPTDGTCDDGNACTVGDACDPNGDCVPAAYAASGTSCVGDNPCTQVGTCDGAGDCAYDAGLAVSCPSLGSPCVSNACDPASGKCVTSPNVGPACDDKSACTTDDACDGLGTCSGAPLACADAYGCTENSCDAKTGCVFSPQSDLCDDENACTNDTCDPKSGCTHAPATGKCDDGDSCTLEDACTSGKCVGKPNPTCGCKTTADCASLEDGDKCNGLLACLSGTCQIDPASVVTCPPDGYQCVTGWACDKASGECKGAPQTCDDGIDCTTDSCSVTEGCKHKAVFGCPIGYVCAISGKKGDTIDCMLRLVRAKQGDPIPSGADVALHWDQDKVALQNLSDAICFGAQCFPYDIVTCEQDNLTCSYEKLSPSGDDVVAVPKDIAEWTQKIYLTIFNAGAVGKPLTSAFLDGSTIVGDPEFVTARFELLTDIPAASALHINASDVKFNPATGEKMLVSIQEIGGVRTFVATAP